MPCHCTKGPPRGTVYNFGFAALCPTALRLLGDMKIFDTRRLHGMESLLPFIPTHATEAEATERAELAVKRVAEENPGFNKRPENAIILSGPIDIAVYVMALFHPQTTFLVSVGRTEKGQFQLEGFRRVAMPVGKAGSVPRPATEEVTT